MDNQDDHTRSKRARSRALAKEKDRIKEHDTKFRLALARTFPSLPDEVVENLIETSVIDADTYAYVLTGRGDPLATRAQADAYAEASALSCEVAVNFLNLRNNRKRADVRLAAERAIPPAKRMSLERSGELSTLLDEAERQAGLVEQIEPRPQINLDVLR